MFGGFPKEKRLFFLCGSGEIEDEVHFMCDRSFCDYTRATLFSHISSVSDDFLWVDDYEKKAGTEDKVLSLHFNVRCCVRCFTTATVVHVSMTQ